MPHQNDVLAGLPPADLAAILPHLRVVSARPGELIAEAKRPVAHVYFPHSGVLSYLVELQNGVTIETAMAGKDGVAGAGPVLADQVSANKIAVRLAGAASVIEAAKLRDLASQRPGLRAALDRGELELQAQAQQTAACNAVHSIEQRVSRWLMRMHDLAGDRLPVTQILLARLLGVRRTSVTAVAAGLQRAGAIRCTRGMIHIVDPDKLKAAACECYESAQCPHAAWVGASEPQRAIRLQSA